MIADPGTQVGWLQGFHSAVDRLVEASNAGYTVSDEGGQALLNAITTLHDKVRGHLRQTHEFPRLLQLGSSPGAAVYTPFLASIADDLLEGLEPVLRRLMLDLEHAHDTIQRNMAGYRRAELENAARIGSTDAAR